MKKIKDFLQDIDDKIYYKCEKFQVNKSLIHIMLVNNLLICECPCSPTFAKKVIFKGENKNYYNVILDLDSYLESGIPNIFTKEKTITEEQYDRLLDRWSNDYETTLL